ncbi:uncharacterized protein [Anoplolepis gracilipes]|uniref:uncharacterized protein n=1 Tax=Anoplolepis gracilipes TaxID=354296 RepID=UPI003BA13BAA
MTENLIKEQKKEIMKLFARPKCLTEAIASVITLNRLMGFRAFEYPRGQSRPVLSLLYLLLLYCLYCNYSLYALEKEYHMYTITASLELLFYKILYYISTFFIFVKLLLGWWYSKRFAACYKKLSEIDETLRQLGSVIKYDRMYFTIIGVMIIWIIFNFAICIIIYMTMRAHADVHVIIIMIAVNSYSVTASAIVIFEFYIFVKCLEMRFDFINRLLREHLTMLSVKEIKLGFFEMQDYTKIMNVEQQCSFPIKILSQWCGQVHFLSHFQKEKLQNRAQKHNSIKTKCQKRKYFLQIIKQVHLELCKVSKTVCTILGIQTVCEIGIIIMSLTGHFYSLYIRYYTHNITDLVLQQIILTIILNFLHILKITILSRVCKHATNKGNETIEIIYSIYGCDAEFDVQEEIQQFDIQMLQSPLKFSAYGISLDNSVLTMMLKVIITYLIIMIQLNN